MTLHSGSGTKFLCAVFLSSALGWAGDAGAVNARDKPVIRPGKSLPESSRPVSCVQRVAPNNANRNGYHSLPVMRRAAALAQIYDQQAVAAIAIASYETGIDFDLLVMKAILESRMGEFDQPHLGGSARGLFHFMPATWMTLFSWFGAEFQNEVYTEAASLIKFDESKNPYTDNPALTEQILALRSDHHVAAYIKAKSVLHDERPLMVAILGREPNFTDYYVAHFLGLERAKTFFRALRKTPGTAAADIFTRESDDPNNRPIFYNGNRKRTMQQVYNLLGSKVNGTLLRLDRQIAQELSQKSCVPFVPLQRPPRTVMEIPPMPDIPEPRPQFPPPTIPPRELPPEEDVPDPPAPLPQDDFAPSHEESFTP